MACNGKMTELLSFHLVPHFWGIFFRCYDVVPYALVSFDIPFTVIRFNGNYLKTEMLKLFRIFKEKMLEVEKITRQHCQICLKFRIGILWKHNNCWIHMTQHRTFRNFTMKVTWSKVYNLWVPKSVNCSTTTNMCF